MKTKTTLLMACKIITAIILPLEITQAAWSELSPEKLGIFREINHMRHGNAAEQAKVQETLLEYAKADRDAKEEVNDSNAHYIADILGLSIKLNYKDAFNIYKEKFDKIPSVEIEVKQNTGLLYLLMRITSYEGNDAGIKRFISEKKPLFLQQLKGLQEKNLSRLKILEWKFIMQTITCLDKSQEDISRFKDILDYFANHIKEIKQAAQDDNLLFYKTLIPFLGINNCKTKLTQEKLSEIFVLIEVCQYPNTKQRCLLAYAKIPQRGNTKRLTAANALLKSLRLLDNCQIIRVPNGENPATRALKLDALLTYAKIPQPEQLDAANALLASLGIHVRYGQITYEHKTEDQGPNALKQEALLAYAKIPQIDNGNRLTAANALLKSFGLLDDKNCIVFDINDKDQATRALKQDALLAYAKIPQGGNHNQIAAANALLKSLGLLDDKNCIVFDINDKDPVTRALKQDALLAYAKIPQPGQLAVANALLASLGIHVSCGKITYESKTEDQATRALKLDALLTYVKIPQHAAKRMEAVIPLLRSLGVYVSDVYYDINCKFITNIKISVNVTRERSFNEKKLLQNTLNTLEKFIDYRFKNQYNRQKMSIETMETLCSAGVNVSTVEYNTTGFITNIVFRVNGPLPTSDDDKSSLLDAFRTLDQSIASSLKVEYNKRVRIILRKLITSTAKPSGQAGASYGQSSQKPPRRGR